MLSVTSFSSRGPHTLTRDGIDVDRVIILRRSSTITNHITEEGHVLVLERSCFFSRDGFLFNGEIDDFRVSREVRPAIMMT